MIDPYFFDLRSIFLFFLIFLTIKKPPCADLIWIKRFCSGASDFAFVFNNTHLYCTKTIKQLTFINYTTIFKLK